MSSPVAINQADLIDHLSTREAYDRWAEIYDGEKNPLVALEEPQVERMLGNVSGLQIADLGCGTGRHSLRLALAGAHVTALDFSEVMLNKARAKAGALSPLQLPGVGEGSGVRAPRAAGQREDSINSATPSPQPSPKGRGSVRFIRHDLAQKLPLNDQAFDRVVCGLVLDHVADLRFVFSEMKRICKPGPRGFIVVSLMHPALMLRGVQARFTDPVSGREIRPQSCPHQVSDYVMAVMNAGLRIDHMSEHVADEALASRCPRAEKYIGWPLLIMLKLSYS